MKYPASRGFFILPLYKKNNNGKDSRKEPTKKKPQDKKNLR